MAQPSVVPKTMARPSGCSRTPIVCPSTVMIRKLTCGVHSERSHHGVERLRPRALAHSEAAPIGHSKPHQLRPVKTTESSTSGNHSPHMM